MSTVIRDLSLSSGEEESVVGRVGEEKGGGGEGE